MDSVFISIRTARHLKIWNGTPAINENLIGNWEISNGLEIMSLSNSSTLLYRGPLYMLSAGGGEFTCLNATTREQLYKEKIGKVRSIPLSRH